MNIVALVFLIIVVIVLLLYLVYSCTSIVRSDIEKKRTKERLDKIISIKTKLFPYNSLQEREINFSEFYQYYGDEFIDLVMKNIDPFDPRFLIIEL